MDGQEPVFSGYPPGCPLPEAVPADGQAFRIVESDPPTEWDFQSHHERGETPRSTLTRNQQCKWRSLSIYRTIEDARHHLRVFECEDSFIAAGTLTRWMGKTIPSPSRDRPSHASWWRADGVDWRTVFSIIE